ncbi:MULTISPECIES: aspartate/glutamate racemase family protein [unclassified Acidisoma]|uniref:aspartate/glutamate racemase family protein n=1 Tax=unclassified Acidisoma TaxID=2634065 RepID=UPI0020B16F06|nr:MULTISPECIES: amino acid racemase [unclassified Acidisoma]
MKRIGIIGGSSDVATADYYRRLNAAVNARLGGWNTAELVMTSMNFAFCTDCVHNGRWEVMGAYLADRAAALEAAGADFFLCVSNTLHRLADVFTAGRAIPFLHIVDPTARAIQAAGLSRIALLGTKPTMATEFLRRRYTEQFGIRIDVPVPEEQDVLDRIIFDELCRGQFTDSARATYLAVVDRLAAQGSEGVILGCTEIPLLITQSDRPGIPMFDTTGLHVEAAVELALA